MKLCCSIYCLRWTKSKGRSTSSHHVTALLSCSTPVQSYYKYGGMLWFYWKAQGLDQQCSIDLSL
ncbi:hypothetical protein BJX76DRAFT_270418 [Aspergillus varians]